MNYQRMDHPSLFFTKSLRIIVWFRILGLIMLLCFHQIRAGETMSSTYSFEIVLSADASSSEQFAANELAKYLAIITGNPLLTTHTPSPGKIHLFVGAKAALLADPQFSVKEMGKEGISLQSVGSDLILAGNSGRGTLYAVYTFLEDYAGCRWWTKSATFIPQKKDFRLPENLHLTYVPVLEYRWPYWFQSFDPEWMVHNKVNGLWGEGANPSTANCLLDSKYGGYVTQGGVHTSFQHILPARYFAAHPEWFSEVKGKRQPLQLCLANEEMGAEYLKNLKAYISAHPDQGVYSVSQNDGNGACECVRCKALVEKYGGVQAGPILDFVNRVAAGIHAEYPEVSLSTLAYHYSQNAPKNIVAHDNVIIQLCSYSCGFSLPMDSENSTRNRAFASDIRAWSLIAKKLYIWDYTTDFSHYLLPYPNLRVMDKNIDFLINHNARGIFMQGAHDGATGAEFAPLRAWVQAKLLWNPKLNAPQLIAEFCNGYYSDAGRYIQDYITIVHDEVERTKDELDCYSPANAKYINFPTMNQSWLVLGKAAAAVTKEPEILRRVQLVQLNVLYAFLMNWDSFKAEAAKESMAWPLPENRSAAAHLFLSLAGTNEVNTLCEWTKGFRRIEEMTMTPLGQWLPEQVKSSAGLLTWNVTNAIHKSGTYDFRMAYVKGSNALKIDWLALYDGDLEIARDAHSGYAGLMNSKNTYSLDLKTYSAQSTYTLKAKVTGDGGTNSQGTLYLVNGH